MIQRLVVLLLSSLALLSLPLFGAGCGSTPQVECKWDEDCAGKNALCKDGKCLNDDNNNNNTDSGPKPDLAPPPECQDGHTRVCYSGDEKTRGVGACKEGKQTCTSGKWGACEGEVGPVDKEDCNDKDDDCDGVVDEGCPCKAGETKECYGGPAATKANAPCSAGTQKCGADGNWEASCNGETRPAKEGCNGIDDDCNGQIDDDCPCKAGETSDCYTGPPSTQGQGTCKTGTMKCLDSEKWGACEGARPPEKEDCNGEDDDCDGKVDNGCDCTPGKTQECYTGPPNTDGKGECKKGEQTCKADGTWGDCLDEVKPGNEDCNGKDDDCNGQVDDNLSAPECPKQEGVCVGAKKKCDGANGWKDCADAEYTAYSSDYEQDETACDNKDNDCDGQTDENLTRPCFSAAKGCTKQADGTYQCKGTCQAGTQTCNAGGWEACQGEVGPQTEVCDGKDDDCDGQIDNGCQCRPGESRKCYGGPANTEGKGICTAGNQTCNSSGAWGPCVGEVTPTNETCNGKDDDCNDQTDDNLIGPPCSKKFGVCVGLRQKCDGANGWKDCSEADYKANSTDYETTETMCDGKDNNCDGQIDEGVTRPCYEGSAGCTKQADGTYQCDGTCKAGSQACRNGNWGTCTGATEPTQENCTNQQDDDCNGKVDDCGVCNDGDKQPCYTGTSGCTKRANGTYACVGACKAGTQTCTGGQWPTTCTGQTAPKAETCNWLDDNCDGKVDEKGACFYSSWKNSTLPSGARHAAFYDESVGVAVGTSGRIWRTTNAGASWSSVNSPITANFRSVAVNPNGLAVAVGDSGNVAYSHDEGVTWTKATSSVTNTLYAVSLSTRFHNTYPSALAVGTSGTIIGSKDGGKTWTKLTSGVTNSLRSVEYRYNSGNVLVTGTAGTILRSTNYGNTWTKVTSGVTVALYAVTWSYTSGTAIAVGSSGTVVRTTNSGASWTKVNFPNTRISLNNALSPGTGTFLVASTGSSYYLSTDNGVTFTQQSYGTSGSFSRLVLRTPTSLLAIGSTLSAVGEGPAQLARSTHVSQFYSVGYSNYITSNTSAYAVGQYGTLYKSSDYGGTWQRQYLPTVAHLNAVSYANDHVLAVGNSGTAFRSTDGGKTWTKVDVGSTTTLRGVAIYQQTSPSRYIGIIVGSSGTIRWSIDGGATWRAPTYPSTTTTFYSVSIKDSRVVAVGSGGTVYRSIDAGQNYTRVTSNTTSTLYDVYLYSASGTGLAVGSSGTIIRTTNGGATWATVTSGSTASLRGVAIGTSTYAVAVGSSGTVLRSTNGGAAWTKVQEVPYTTYYDVFRRYGSGYYLAVGTSNTIIRSTNYGTSWSETKDFAAYLRGVSSPGTNLFVAGGNSATLYNSSDAGKTFSRPIVPASTATLYGMAYEPTSRAMVAVGSSGTVLRSTTQGASWTAVTSGYNSTFQAATQAAANIFLAVGNSGNVYRSTNAGTSWTKVTSNATSTLRGADCSGSRCLIVGSSNTIIRSTNSGASWTGITSPATATFYGVAFGNANNAVIVGSSGNILYSTNGGSSWTKATSPSTNTLYGVTAIDAQRFLAFDSIGRLIASADGGKNWTFHSPTLNVPLLDFAINGNNGVGVGSSRAILLYAKP